MGEVIVRAILEIGLDCTTHVGQGWPSDLERAFHRSLLRTGDRDRVGAMREAVLNHPSVNTNLPCKEPSASDPPAVAVARSIRSIWPLQQMAAFSSILAVSGGADSVALLLAVEQLVASQTLDRNRFTVVHVNHGLRGQASMEDEQFVADLAAERNFRLVVRRIDPDRLGRRAVSESHRGQGLESLARNARYECLRSVAEEIGARYIATGHNFDDHIETVLLRILRGTGLTGLIGIPAIRRLTDELSLIRPLRLIDRVTIEAFLEGAQQSYCNDATNLDIKFARNRIRNQVLPFLRGSFQWPVVESLNNLSRNAADFASFMSLRTNEAFGSVEFSNQEVLISRSVVCSLTEFELQYLFQRIWTAQNWPQQQMSRRVWLHLVRSVLCGTVGGALNLPGNVHVKSTPEVIVIAQRCDPS